jgi:hypothetical protein
VGAISGSASGADRAAALADQARELHAQHEYHEARPLYEQSLELCEDSEVRAAYRKLMATIGPK